jgi:CO dehydrogenase maturation factor
MATTIAISGKGGAGKSTLAAMIIRTLLDQGSKAILAVDADPNSCLAPIMGVETEVTIAEIREKSRQQQPTTGGTDKLRSLEYGIQQAITEATGFDLLTMGRPEGPSCYCAVNNMLRTFLDKLGTQYEYVIIDNEAGMEHLSRRTTNNVDLLFIVAEQTTVGDLTARRIFELAKKLPIRAGEIGIIWNRAESGKKLEGMETFGYVPYEKVIHEASMQGKTIFDIEDNSAAFSAVRKILESKLNRSFQLNKNKN